ncbi:type IV secretory system conjugative DNA transfer family protein [uncultured Albimonas sp.]|uniref:type IV secretory system conjugative DNA transfer family protein n=1 Tax=uncultured Albimonas sp. TaxID=1331701 RepID=UPI0030EFA3FA|tara:strand:+ start:2156 stop:3964 length:1809 start_codon:yes stop_codon:yes gene_type:complete
MRPSWKTPALVAGASAGLCLLSATAQAQPYLWRPRTYEEVMLQLAIMRVGMMVLATLAGFVIGWFLSPEGRLARRLVLMAMAAVAVVVSVIDEGALGWSTAVLMSVVGFCLALGYWLARAVRKLGEVPTTFGSAKWADAEHMASKKLFGTDGLVLGQAYDGHALRKFAYKGDRHLLTVAPTRSGKGVSHIVPNLLTYPGSALVIDPKGENAMITADARDAMGQEVLLVDPWNIAAGAMGREPARFNPLDWLQLGDVDITENAMLLADAIVQQQDAKGDAFWREEAKALIQGAIMHVAVDEAFEGRRHLGTVRDLLLLSGPDMKVMFERMANSPHHIVASTGARSLQKEERLMANVLASAQAETHMLDSARLRESLSVSDFRFEDLKKRPMTVYLILPADRLDAFSRFLRLLVQQAITVNARNIEDKPKKPVLFLLDEMAALGRLSSVEQAYGLMAGFGMQLWGVVQDLCQLRKVYGDDYESFIANSGAVSYFGSPDKTSAEYFSAMCGVTTVWNFSSALASAFNHGSGPGGNSIGSSWTETDTRAAAQRKLAYPDELMRLQLDRQLVLIENTDPIMARKLRWYEDPELQAKGMNLHRPVDPS